MDEVVCYLEMSALNSELAEAYLKDADDELSTLIERLEDCLELVTELRQCELFYCGSWVL